jgi:ubiquinone biosynthesis protein
VGRPTLASAQRLAGRCTGHVLNILGPGYAKAGQILSTRQDILPEGFCSGLSAAVIGDRALDGCRRGSVATVIRVPGQGGGPDYALKQLRPHAASSLRRNLVTLRTGARWASRLPALSGIPVVQMTTDISRAVAAQVDLEHERASLERLRSAVDPDTVHVPAVVHENCSSDVLAMEWMESDSALDIADLPEGERHKIMTNLVRALLRMIFVDGFFHCDLHPGNWWRLPDGRIAIVDAGFTYELGPQQRWHFIEFFYGMAFGDGEHAFRHMIATADTASLPPPPRLEALRVDVVTLVEDQYDAPVAEFNLARFGSELFQIQRRHGFRGDTSFVFPLIALLSIEGQLKQFSPTLDFQAIARRELGRPLLRLRAQFVPQGGRWSNA